MSNMDEQQMLAFRDELQKFAAGIPVGAAKSIGRRISGAAGRAIGGIGSALERPAPGALSRFAQRQFHGLSGWTPQGGLSSIHGGAHDARQALEAATKAGKGVTHAQKAYDAAHAAEKAGLTSLPGYAKALAKNPGKTLKTDVSAQWHAGGRLEKALGVGLPAAMLAGDVRRPESQTGPGKGELIGRSLGGTAGGFLGSAMPITGQLMVGGAVGAAGGLIGRGVDRLRGRRPGSPPPPTAGQPIPPEQQSGSHVPTERVMSPAAMGQAPEGMTA